jgi:hypothetical protein
MRHPASGSSPSVASPPSRRPRQFPTQGQPIRPPNLPNRSPSPKSWPISSGRATSAAKLCEWLGKKGSRQWIDGFGLASASGIALEDIEYQAVLGRNWLSPWVEGGRFCGSCGMALPLLEIKVRLKGAAAKAFETSYSATFMDGSAVGPVIGGEACRCPPPPIARNIYEL